VNIDDCWAVKNKRDESTGYMIPDPKKFPRGISGTAETIHRMGLKIGIYSSAGAMTCALYPASLEHEQVDAKSFAEWGIDCELQVGTNSRAVLTNQTSSMTIASMKWCQGGEMNASIVSHSTRHAIATRKHLIASCVEH